MREAALNVAFYMRNTTVSHAITRTFPPGKALYYCSVPPSPTIDMLYVQMASLFKHSPPPSPLIIPVNSNSSTPRSDSGVYSAVVCLLTDLAILCCGKFSRVSQCQLSCQSRTIPDTHTRKHSESRILHVHVHCPLSNVVFRTCCACVCVCVRICA